MAIKTEYICDICTRSMPRLAALDKMVGVRFGAGYSFSLTDVQQTDGRHLCRDCCVILKKALNEMENI